MRFIRDSFDLTNSKIYFIEGNTYTYSHRIDRCRTPIYRFDPMPGQRVKKSLLLTLEKAKKQVQVYSEKRISSSAVVSEKTIQLSLL